MGVDHVQLRIAGARQSAVRLQNPVIQALHPKAGLFSIKGETTSMKRD